MSTATLERSTAKKTPKASEKLGVFRLVSGVHIGVQEGWERPVHPETKKPLFNDPETGQVIMPPKHVYRFDEPGNNIVRERRDLVAMFGADKFQRISGDPSVVDPSTADLNLLRANEQLVQENEARMNRILELEAQLGLQNAPTTEPGLAGMTKAQLVTYAEENEIDLGDARTKDDILAVIQLAQPGK